MSVYHTRPCDAFTESIRSGQAYQTRLDLPRPNLGRPIRPRKRGAEVSDFHRVTLSGATAAQRMREISGKGCRKLGEMRQKTPTRLGIQGVEFL